MIAPWAFLINTPLKLAILVGNRLATWTGLFYLWRRVASRRTHGWRTFLLWALGINLVSLSLLAGLLFWFAHRGHS